jgi:protein gp37
MGNPRYRNDGDRRTSGPGFGVTLHWDKLDEPLHWRRPRRIFVNSMSDLWHPRVTDGFIAAMFDVMERCSQHQFLVLTKRPRRMVAWIRQYRPEPLPNLWLGVSVEDQEAAEARIPKLLETPAAVRFLSCEPLLGPVDLHGWIRPCACGGHDDPHPTQAIDWVIAGGESGDNFRSMDPEWARFIRDQCLAAGVAFYYKQGSGIRPEMDRTLDGRMWDQFPTVPAPPEARDRAPGPAAAPAPSA